MESLTLQFVPIVKQSSIDYAFIFNIVVDVIFGLQTLNDVIIYITEIVFMLTAGIMFLVTGSVSALAVPFTAVISFFGVSEPPLFYLLYLPAFLSTTGVLQYYSNISRAVLVNMFDPTTFDSADPYMLAFFYYIPSIFTYNSYLFDVLISISAVYSIIESTTNYYTWTLAIIGVVMGLVLNSVYTFVPHFISNYEFFGTF